jgi:ABC-type phosphate transport system substrate-binding protein
LLKLGNEKPIFRFILAIFFIFAGFSPVVTAAELVVNKTVSATDCSKADIRAIFTMKKTVWSNSRQIRVYTLPDNNPLHKDFVKNNLHMLAHQLRRVWDRMTYSGTGVAPIELGSEQEMTDKIANTPDSIGYLKSRPDNENIHSFVSE